MICETGDIVVVPFPFVDVAALKRRPSVILSNGKSNDQSGHSICAMITTAAYSHWESDVAIDDLGSAGLQRPCVIRWKVFTLPNENILRRLGALGASDRTAVMNAGRRILF